MNETMIKSLGLLLGGNLIGVPLDFETYEAVIEMSKKAYQRFKGAGYSIENAMVYSWVHDYALAQCKLMLGEQQCRYESSSGQGSNQAELMISTALVRIETLESELR